MMWELMKRDPAWRWTPYSALALGAWCGAWHYLWPGHGHASSILLNTTFVIPLLAGASAILVQQDDTALEATLPVTVRQVFVARMISVLLLVAASVMTAVAVLLALGDPAASELPFGMMSIFAGGLMMVFAAGFSTVRIARGSMFAIAPLWLFAASMSVIYSPGLPVLACCWLLSVAYIARTWHGLPLSFQSAPVMATAPKRTMAAAVDVRRPHPWKTVFMALYRGGGLIILVPFFVVAAGTANTFFYVWVGMEWGSKPREWLAALPFPPRAFLAMAVMPTLLALVAGSELSVYLNWLPRAETRGLQVGVSRGLPKWTPFSREIPLECRTPNVLPSLEYWLKAGSGAAPVVTAPWGETFQPPVFRASGHQVYNPWAVGCKNSERFLDWQFMRATTAMYGRPLVRDKDARWMELMPKTGLRWHMVRVLVLTVISLVSLLVAMLFDWYRVLQLQEGLRRAISVVVGVCGAGLFMALLFQSVDIFQWASWSLSDSTALAGLELSACIAVLAWAVDSLFGQVEITPVRKSS